MKLTAAQRYLSRLYEEAVDSNLDLEAIRVRLAARGVLKTPAAVRYDLDHVFCFAGYADSHPAAPAVSAAHIDRLIENERGYIRSYHKDELALGTSLV